MKVRLIRLALAAGLLLPTAAAYAAEGAATGNATSTPAGPAGDNSGPTKSGGMSPGKMMHGHMKKMKHHHSAM